MKNVAFSDDLEPFEFKHFPRRLAPIMVGPAGDTKLSAFCKMCFSKPPHFGNRGAAPVIKTNFITFQIVDPEICSILNFL